MRRTLSLLAAALGVAAASLAGPAGSAGAADAHWSVVVLRGLEPTHQVKVEDLNESGTTTGWSSADPFAHVTPVRWDTQGNPTELALPAGCTAGEGRAINNAGVIAGNAACAIDNQGTEDNFAVAWLADGTPVKLLRGLLVEDITEDNVLVGDGQDNVAPPSGPNGPMAFLSGHPVVRLSKAGLPFGHVAATTDFGYSVGDVQGDPLPGLPAVIAVGWFQGQVFPLMSTHDWTNAVDVNANGVALVSVGRTDPRAYTVAPGGATTELDRTGVADHVVDLNDYGIAVGRKQIYAGAIDETHTKGVVYAFGTSIRLSDLVAPADSNARWYAEPVRINNAAWIAGNEPSHISAWLLKPPST